MIKSKKKNDNNGALSGIKVLDLSRILAGPTATQILGDMGADVIKVERPNMGDDTRHFGPPFLKKDDGKNSTESSYYLSTNRNKRSISIDYSTEDGRILVKQLAKQCDILVENYIPGTLEKYGLGYDEIKQINPKIIYCALTGFGQTGPYAHHAGYDLVIQAMGGLMSMTGEVDGLPSKTGVAVTDLMSGLYLTIGALAALNHRNKTGLGQFIDVSLLDTQVASLSNTAQYYLTSGKTPKRMGNAHSTIVPYQTFETTNGHIAVAIANDKQFETFCDFIEQDKLHKNKKYATNEDRVKNRETLIPILETIFKEHPQEHWIKNLDKLKIPCGPVNTIDKVFENEQVKHRDMTVKMPHPDNKDGVTLLSNPIKFSDTEIDYRYSPPKLGEHTDEILQSWLNLSEHDIELLKAKKTI